MINKNITIKILSTSNGYILEHATPYEEREVYNKNCVDNRSARIPSMGTMEVYATSFDLYKRLQELLENEELLPPMNVRSITRTLEDDIVNGTH